MSKTAELEIKVGDLVMFKPTNIPGALTAAKYMGRMEKRFAGRPGLVIRIPIKTKTGTSVLVQIENDSIVIPSQYLEVINEDR